MNAGKTFNYTKIVLQFVILNSSFIILLSCSPQKQISKSATKFVLKDSALLTAHVGISIFDPAANKYLYNFQGDKYFVPASNTKIPTCYAAMKYLGDSLVGLTYDELPDQVFIQPNGDPTFLLPEFNNQPAFDFLKSLNKPIKIALTGWEEQPLGSGWAWNDYEETYMAERSAMPIYGNIIQFSGKQLSLNIVPRKAIDHLVLDSVTSDSYLRLVRRSRTGNRFNIIAGGVKPSKIAISFDTENSRIIEKLLADTLKQTVRIFYPQYITPYRILPDRLIKTQPTDSLLKPMMHRSDNFFAEQSLLMVSNKLLGLMNDEKIIDTLLKTDFKDLPQRPRWADGSGLSRYNLFTPQDFVAILNMMKNEFGMERIKNIFPTGNEGTLSNYYKADSGYIFAKTGSLSGVIAFSGFLVTKKNKLLIFSVLVNNHRASAAAVRRAVEKFVQLVRRRY